MAQDPDEIVVAPAGEIYTAPVGTTEPTDETAALDAAFVELGLCTTDGLTFRDGASQENIFSWQRFQPIRVVLTEKNTQVVFALQQWNRETIVVAFGGGTVTEPTANHYKFEPPDPGDGVAELCIVADWHDGDKDYRLVVPRASLGDTVETQFTRSAEAQLPLTFNVLGPETGAAWYLLTNDPAFES